jgi:RNA polymerase sigma-B factor
MAYADRAVPTARAAKRALRELHAYRSQSGVARHRQKNGAGSDLHRRAEVARETLLHHYTPLARRLAARHLTPAERFDDLLQVALLALLQAIERFDPRRGIPFSAYAAARIGGELKRHLRDNTWALHVPRTERDRALALRRASALIPSACAEHERGRRELAALLGIDEGLLREALAAASAYLALPLPAGAAFHGQEQIGVEDPGMARIEEGSHLRSLLGLLRMRERQILFLRFVCELTQAEIAEQLGISQMHVSRLLRSALATLRESASA